MNSDAQLQTRLYQILGIIEQQQAQNTKLLSKLEGYIGLERQITAQSLAAIRPILAQEFQKSLTEQRNHMKTIREEFDQIHKDRHMLWESKRQRTYLIFTLIGFVFGMLFTYAVIVKMQVNSRLSDISQRLEVMEKR
jgi:hypothetical protein